MTERNAFRTALITYQRTRRSLQTAEDNLKIQLRNDLRQVHLSYITYEIDKRNFELNVRLKDQAFEQIVAPPAGGGSGLAQIGQRRDPDHQPAQLPEQPDRRGSSA